MAAQNKALLSFKNPKAPFDAAAEVAEELLLSHRLLELKDDVACVLQGLPDEDRALIEFRYFRKKEPAHDCDTKLRRYYRRQKEILETVRVGFVAAGWTEKLFRAYFGRFSPFLKIARALVITTRGSLRKNRLHQASDCSESAGEVFRPRRTRMATAIPAAETAQIMAMRRPVSDSVAEPPMLPTGSSGR